MSKFLTPTLYNGKGLENQLRNVFYNAHDLACGCNKPKQHILTIIGGSWPDTIEKDPGNGTPADDETGFDAGDLEKLFENKEENER